MVNERAATIGTVIANICFLVIIVVVLHIGQTQFERISLSLLIFILFNSTFFATSYYRNTDTTHAALQEQILKIRKELGKSSTTSDQEALALLRDRLEMSKTRFWINWGFCLLFLLIAAVNVLINL